MMLFRCYDVIPMICAEPSRVLLYEPRHTCLLLIRNETLKSANA